MIIVFFSWYKRLHYRKAMSFYQMVLLVDFYLDIIIIIIIIIIIMIIIVFTIMIIVIIIIIIIIIST